MKISIITVSLNEVATIEKTLLSVFNQKYTNWELLLVDGASTDGTLEIIEKYKDKIHYFVSEQDDGIYYAMNKGIDNVTGDFILFLNANDSLFDENVLGCVADVLTENKDVDLLYGDTNCIKEDGSSSHLTKYKGIDKDFRQFFLTENICHQSIFYRRELFENFGKYDVKWKITADRAFNVECILKHGVKSIYIPITISNFLLGGFCSNKKFKKKQREEYGRYIKRFYNKYYKFILLNNFLGRWFGSFYRECGQPFDIRQIVKKENSD